MPLRASRRFSFILVIGLFVAANLALIAAMGVRTGADTSLYFEGAQHLLHGEPLLARQPSYIGYVVLLAIIQWTHAGNTTVVVAQLLAATAAAVVVYKMGTALGGPAVGTIAVALLALDIETNRWQAYVLSDSLYMSALTIAVWAVYRAAQSPVSARRWLLPAAAILAAGLIRPEGWFLIPVVAVYLIVKAPSPSHRARYAGAMLAIALAIAALVVPRLGGNVSEIGPNRMLRAGQTIWAYDGWRIPMPAGAPSQGGESAAAVAYALQHPVSTAVLMTARVVVHLAHIRPFYSTAHNAVILGWLIPVYTLTLIGWWKVPNRPLAWWLSALASQTAVVAIGHADWDGRYLAHVLPMIYPFAAVGAVWTADRLRLPAS